MVVVALDANIAVAAVLVAFLLVNQTMIAEFATLSVHCLLLMRKNLLRNPRVTKEGVKKTINTSS